MGEKMLVIGEIKNGTVRHVAYEAIAAAKSINEEAEIIGVLCSNKEQTDLAKSMIHYGADRIIVITHPDLEYYTPDGYGQAVMSVINDENPNGIIMGQTAIGKDLTPKLASKMECGLISDVVAIEVNEDEVTFTRPIFSGKAFEKKIINDDILFATIRPNNITSLEKDESRDGKIESKEVDIKTIRTVVKEVIHKTSTGVDLSEARIVVAGGRGVKSKEGFEPLYKLAKALGGAVGASRGACDAGYCDYSLQIGQTGKVVTPDLYIAVGISGAIQHLAGMSNSKVIVAINKDPEASIFKMADYGIVGDLFEVIPLLIKEIEQIKREE